MRGSSSRPSAPTASGLTFAAGSGGNLLVLGLSNVDAVNPLGASQLATGGHLVADGAGSIFAQPDSFPVNIGSGQPTGKAIGDTFDFTVQFTAEGAGLFTVDQQIDGSTVFSQTGQAFDFGNSGTDTTGHIQDFGGVSSYSVDGLTLDVTVIPEPSSFALIALGAAVFGLRRRR